MQNWLMPCNKNKWEYTHILHKCVGFLVVKCCSLVSKTNILDVAPLILAPNSIFGDNEKTREEIVNFNDDNRC